MAKAHEADTRRERARHDEITSRLPLAFYAPCLAMVVLQWTTDSPTALAFFAAITACFAAMFDEPRVVLFCAGLTVTFGASQFSGIPLSLFVPVAILVGAVLARPRVASDRQFELKRPRAALLALTLATGLYYLAVPPEANAAVLTGFVLVALPFTLFSLRVGVQHSSLGSSCNLAFAAGAASSVGLGLAQAYEFVGQNYSDYETARIFESAIGSSNFAAGLASVVGIHTLSLAGAARGYRRLAMGVVALAFLSAPLVFASRGALLSSAAGLLAFALVARQAGDNRSHRPRSASSPIPRLVVLASTAVVMGFVASRQGWFVWDRLMDRVQSGAGVSSGRTRLWQTTLEFIYANPFFGAGPGAVTDHLLRTAAFAYSHNYLLDLGAQLGLVGGAVYLFVVRPYPLMTPTIAMPAIVAIAVNSLVEPNISTAPGAALYAGLTACHWVAAASQRTSAAPQGRSQ